MKTTAWCRLWCDRPRRFATKRQLRTSLAEEFGDRWPGLLAALNRPKSHVFWSNPFCDRGAVRKQLEAFGLQPLQLLPTATNSSEKPSPQLQPVPKPRTNLVDEPEDQQQQHHHHQHQQQQQNHQHQQQQSDSQLSSFEPSALELWRSQTNPGGRNAWLPKPPTCPISGLKMYYPLDLASVLPVLALLSELLPGGETATREVKNRRPFRVVDACSAPGGKTLLLAGALLSRNAPLRTQGMIAVEQDRFRASRLRQNLDLYLGPTNRRRVLTIADDFTRASSLLGREAPFEAILVDAPCSSERELLLAEMRRGEGKTEMSPPQKEDLDTLLPLLNSSSKWAPRQEALLAAAVRLADPVGLVVYSTCALSNRENDHVVENVLREAPVGWRTKKLMADQEVGRPWIFDPEHVERVLEIDIEETKYGYRVLPDNGGFGPMYWSVLVGPAR